MKITAKSMVAVLNTYDEIVRGGVGLPGFVENCGPSGSEVEVAYEVLDVMKESYEMQVQVPDCGDCFEIEPTAWDAALRAARWYIAEAQAEVA